jgi:4-amino-4-deoxy-L-arabinose transferase-like glycosyltransferase
MARSLKLYLLPLLILAAVTVPHLEQGDFRRDTGRYAAVGHYMWTEGSLAAPYLNPETPYFNKPPLALWIHGWFLKTFGIHLVVARIPSILAALGVVAFSMMAVRQFATRAEAVVSGIVLALTYSFFRRTREISLDFWQLFFLMAAVYLVALAIRKNTRWPVVIAGIPIGLALLCKPLVAFIAVPIFVIWFVIAGRKQLIPWLFIGAVPVAIAVAIPWHLYMYSTFKELFINQYFGHEVVNRARGLLLKKPFWHYFASLAGSYWPWLAAVVFAFYLRKRDGIQRSAPRNLLTFGASWVVVWLILLSIFPDKKPNYALPLYPMLSWLAAFGLCRVPWRKLRVWYHNGFRWLAPSFAALLLILSLAPVQFQSPPDPDWQAVLGWISDNKVDTSKMAHDRVDLNDICYLYLKIGHWVPSVEKAELGSAWTVLAPSAAVTNRTPLFIAGDLALLSVEQWTRPGQ